MAVFSCTPWDFCLLDVDRQTPHHLKLSRLFSGYLTFFYFLILNLSLYHSSSSAVTSELHTPVIINPSGENTNIGVGTIEIHNSDDSLNASGSGSSFSAGFENILDGAGQEEQADSNSRSSDTGDVQGSQMDNLAGGNDTDLSMSSDSDTEDQDE